MLTPDIVPLSFIFNLLLAIVLGVLIGMERSVAGKEAGMRTFALVSLGSCLFMMITQGMIPGYIGTSVIDPSRVLAGIITGIGFLGAGVIIFRHALKGLTTAAGLWVTAGVGAAVGMDMPLLAVLSTLFVVAIFTLLWYLEEYVEANIVLPKRTEQVRIEQLRKEENEEDF